MNNSQKSKEFPEILKYSRTMITSGVILFFITQAFIFLSEYYPRPISRIIDKLDDFFVIISLSIFTILAVLLIAVGIAFLQNHGAQPGRRTSRLAKVSLVMVIGGILCILEILFSEKINLSQDIPILFIGPIFICISGGLFLGILSLVYIFRSKGKLKGQWISVFAIFPALILIAVSIFLTLKKPENAGNPRYLMESLPFTINSPSLVKLTGEDGYIFAGSIGHSGRYDEDIWIIKINGKGEKVWDTTYGGPGNERATCVRETSDGNFIVAGWRSPFAFGADDVWVLKLDKNGNQIWEKTFGDAVREEASSIQQTQDGGYIVAGFKESTDYSYDFWFIKLDKNGNKIWDKVYGTPKDDIAYSIQQTQNGGYIVAGAVTPINRGASNAWIIKLDEKGNKVWDNIYESYSAKFIQQNKNGSYLLVGNDSSHRLKFQNIDKDGNKLWAKTYNSAVDSWSLNSYNFSLINDSDGGFVLAEYMKLKKTEDRYSYPDLYLKVIKLDKNGNELWGNSFERGDSKGTINVSMDHNGNYVVVEYKRGDRGISFLVMILDRKGNKIQEKIYGNNQIIIVKSIKPTSDNGCVLAGYIYPVFGKKLNSVWVSKFDSNGKKIWEKTYSGKDNRGTNDTQETEDGGYILGGCIWSYKKRVPETYQYSWIIKLNGKGDITWDRTFNGSPQSIIQTNKGDYIIAGIINDINKIGSNADMFVSKLDKDGNKIWNKEYGGNFEDYFKSMAETRDGGLVIVGSTRSFGVFPYRDLWIFKVSENGELVWNKTYGYGGINHIQQTQDGCYIGAGVISSRWRKKLGANFWIVKFDEHGKKIWEKVYGTEDEEEAYFIQETSNGGYIVFGKRRQYDTNNKLLSILRLDGKGKKIWEKVYKIKAYSRSSVIQTKENNYIVAGYFYSHATHSNELWILKLDQNGDCTGPNCPQFIQSEN